MVPDRVGGKHKGKRFNVKVDEDTKDEITKLTQRHKLTQQVLIGTLIDMNKRFNFLDQGWESRLFEAVEASDFNRFNALDDACPALAYTHKDGFVCCIKAPTHKKLGNGKTEDKDAICAACRRVKGIVDENELFKRQVREGTTVEIPTCLNGAKISENGDELYCQFSGLWHTIDICRRYDHRLKKSGACGFLAVSKLKVKGVIREVDHK